MTALGAPSAVRRKLAAVVAAVALTAGLAGADVLSSAGPAEALAGSVRAAGAPATSVPVSVPDDAPFQLDLMAVTVTPDPRPASPTSLREVAAATLAELPSSAGVTLRFDDPRLGRHLGGVFMNDPSAILIGASHLGGDLHKTSDVVRHEIAHVYQARLMTTRGYDTVDDRMVQIFGPGGLERAADCVALVFGATWTHYTSDCAGAEKAAAVEALIAGRMP